VRQLVSITRWSERSLARERGGNHGPCERGQPTYVNARRNGIDDRLRQAAATLGASPTRTLLVVDLPAIWKPLLAAAGFAFACSLGEFGATSFLVRDDRPTLPVVIFRLISRPGDLNYGMALAASVVLGATTALVMFAVERLRVPSVGSF